MATGGTSSAGGRRWTSKNLFDVVFDTLPEDAFIDFGPETLMEKRAMESMMGKDEEEGDVEFQDTASSLITDAWKSEEESEMLEHPETYGEDGPSKTKGRRISMGSTLFFFPSASIQRLGIPRWSGAVGAPGHLARSTFFGVRLEVDQDRNEEQEEDEEDEEEEEEIEQGKEKTTSGALQRSPSTPDVRHRATKKNVEDDGMEEDMKNDGKDKEQAAREAKSENRSRRKKGQEKTSIPNGEEEESKGGLRHPAREKAAGTTVSAAVTESLSLSPLTTTGRREALTAEEQLQRMPPGKPRLYEGVCVTIQPLKGFGFLSPQIGGPDIYFTFESLRLTFTRLVLFCYAVQHQDFPLPTKLMQEVSPPTAFFSSFSVSISTDAPILEGGSRNGAGKEAEEQKMRKNKSPPPCTIPVDVKTGKTAEAMGSSATTASPLSSPSSRRIFHAIRTSLHEWERSYEDSLATSSPFGKHGFLPLPPPTWEAIETAWGIASRLAPVGVSLLRWHLELGIPYIASMHPFTFRVQRNRLPCARAKRLLRAEQIRGLPSSYFATVEEQAWFCEAFPNAIGYKHYPPLSPLPSSTDHLPFLNSEERKTEHRRVGVKGEEDDLDIQKGRHPTQEVEAATVATNTEEEEVGQPTLGQKEECHRAECLSSSVDVGVKASPVSSSLVSPTLCASTERTAHEKETSAKEAGGWPQGGDGTFSSPSSVQVSVSPCTRREEVLTTKEDECHLTLRHVSDGSSPLVMEPSVSLPPSRMLERYVGYIRTYNQDLQKGYIACEGQEEHRLIGDASSTSGTGDTSGPPPEHRMRGVGMSSSVLPDVMFSLNSVLLFSSTPRKVVSERLQVRYSVCAMGPHQKYIATLITGMDDQPLSESNVIYKKVGGERFPSAADDGEGGLDSAHRGRGRGSNRSGSTFRQGGRRTREGGGGERRAKCLQANHSGWREEEESGVGGGGGKRIAGRYERERNGAEDGGGAPAVAMPSVSTILQKMYVGGEEDDQTDEEEEEEEMDEGIIDPSTASSMRSHLEGPRKRARQDFEEELRRREGQGRGGPPHSVQESMDERRRRKQLCDHESLEGISFSSTSALPSSSSVLRVGTPYNATSPLRTGVLHSLGNNTIQGDHASTSGGGSGSSSAHPAQHMPSLPTSVSTVDRSPPHTHHHHHNSNGGTVEQVEDDALLLFMDEYDYDHM